MKKKITIIVVCLVLIALITFKLSSNYNKINAKGKVHTELPYVTVNVAEAKHVHLNPNIELVGSLVAFKEMNIMSQTQGQIISLDLKEGQSKTKGSVIATVDKKLKELAVQSAKINVDRLAKDLERYKNLFEGGGVTEQQLEDVRNNYESAKIQYEQAEKQLSDATILAPFNGIITSKKIEQGDFVNIGSPIATIVDISRLKVKLNVSETSAYKLHLGDKAIITTDAYPSVEFTGNISFISPKGDDTHNYPVEIEIANNSTHPLKAGSFVNVSINLGATDNALCIPRESLQGSISDAQVYVAQNGKAVLRNIVVANGDNNYLKVLSGLKEGEQIIVTGQVNLTDGKAIKIIK